LKGKGLNNKQKRISKKFLQGLSEYSFDTILQYLRIIGDDESVSELMQVKRNKKINDILKS